MLKTYKVLWVLIFISSFAFAKIEYKESPEHLSYEARNQNFEFKLEHPFFIIKGTGTNFSGSLSIDLAQLEKGFNFQIDIEKKSVILSNSRLTKSFQKHLSINESKEKNFKINCKEFSIIEDNINNAQNFKVLMYCSINVFDYFSEPVHNLSLSCNIENSVIKCLYSGALKLSELKIKNPRILFIDSKDTVQINGSISFVRKGI